VSSAISVQLRGRLERMALKEARTLSAEIREALKIHAEADAEEGET
jgi:hypothetical protein